MQSCQKKERLLVGLHCNCLRTVHMCFAPAAQQLPHYMIYGHSCLKLSLYTLHILSWWPGLCVCMCMHPSCQTALTLHSTCSQLFISFHCTHYTLHVLSCSTVSIGHNTYPQLATSCMCLYMHASQLSCSSHNVHCMLSAGSQLHAFLQDVLYSLLQLAISYGFVNECDQLFDSFKACTYWHIMDEFVYMHFEAPVCIAWAIRRPSMHRLWCQPRHVSPAISRKNDIESIMWQAQNKSCIRGLIIFDNGLIICW